MEARRAARMRERAAQAAQQTARTSAAVAAAPIAIASQFGLEGAKAARIVTVLALALGLVEGSAAGERVGVGVAEGRSGGEGVHEGATYPPPRSDATRAASHSSR
jgi:hypothetical protein